MKEFDFDKVWIGLLLGLLAPFVTLIMYYQINYHNMSIGHFINYLKMGDTYTPLLSLCTLVNLGVFYPFIWKDKYKGARGVLGATFIWAIIVLFLKFY